MNRFNGGSRRQRIDADRLVARAAWPSVGRTPCRRRRARRQPSVQKEHHERKQTVRTRLHRLARATDEQVAELHDAGRAVVQRFGGTIDKTENWGRRKLAYEIGHHKEGIYVLEVINGAGELMKELDRRLKVTRQVIRHLVVRVDEEQSVAERTRDARKATQAPPPRRARAAAGAAAGREPQRAIGTIATTIGDEAEVYSHERAER